MEELNRTYDKNTDLITRLMDYLKEIDLDEKLEVKPEDDVYFNDNEKEVKSIKADLETLEKDSTTKLDHQLDNIR